MTLTKYLQQLGNILDRIEKYVPLIVISGLIVSGILWIFNLSDVAQVLLFWVVMIGSIPFFLQMVLSFFAKHFGVDLIAAVGIMASLAIGEHLAGAVILLMLSSGKALENFALKRAKKELTALIERAPKIAHLKEENGLKDITVDQVIIDQIFVVKPGELIPIDGQITSGSSSVDESSLTGESLPVQKVKYSMVLSGSINNDQVLEIRATHSSKDSKYQQRV